MRQGSRPARTVRCVLARRCHSTPSRRCSRTTTCRARPRTSPATASRPTRADRRHPLLDSERAADPPRGAGGRARRRARRGAARARRRPVRARDRRGAHARASSGGSPSSSATSSAREDGDGVCANVLFPPYARLLDEAAADADDDYAAAVEAWSAERSVWPLMRVIDRCAPSEPWCRVLAAHLGLDGAAATSGRRFAVAGKLARLFDRYGRVASGHDRRLARRPRRAGRRHGAARRPGLAGRAVAARLRDEIGTPSPAELLDAACARSSAPAPSFSVFGADPHLAVAHPHPARAQRDARSAPVAAPPLAGAVGGRAAGGRATRPAPRSARRRPASAAREHVARRPRAAAVAAGACRTDDEHHRDRRRARHTLLGRLQDELAHDRVPRAQAAVRADDDSIRVHAAHGPARQVEIVREAVLGLLENDPTLEPRDIADHVPGRRGVRTARRRVVRDDRRSRRPSGGAAAREARRPVAAADQPAAGPAVAAARTRRRTGHRDPVARPRRRSAGAPQVRLRRRRHRAAARLDGRVREPGGGSTRRTVARTGWTRSRRAPGAPRWTGCCSASRWRTTSRGSATRCRSTTSTAATSTSPAGSPSSSTAPNASSAT